MNTMARLLPAVSGESIDDGKSAWRRLDRCGSRGTRLVEGFGRVRLGSGGRRGGLVGCATRYVCMYVCLCVFACPAFWQSVCAWRRSRRGGVEGLIDCVAGEARRFWHARLCGGTEETQEQAQCFKGYGQKGRETVDDASNKARRFGSRGGTNGNGG